MLQTMSRLLSTDTVEPRERLAYWVDMVCDTYVQLDCDAVRDDRQIDGQITSDSLATLALSRVCSTAQTVRRTPAKIARATEDYFLVSIQTHGHGRVLQDGRTAVLAPGDFVLYDSTRPYELQFDAPFQQYVTRPTPRGVSAISRFHGVSTMRHISAASFAIGLPVRRARCGRANARCDMAPSMPGPAGRRPLARRGDGQVFFFIAQVLKPNMAYGGHQPMAPVANGTMPSHPQTPILPFSVRPINTNPMMIRAMRSMPPTLLLMMISLTQGDIAASSTRYTKQNLPGCTTQTLIPVKTYCDNRIKLLQWFHYVMYRLALFHRLFRCLTPRQSSTA